MVDLLSIVGPLPLFLLLQILLWDKFVIHAFGEVIPLSLLDIPVQTTYILILKRVYDLDKTSQERLKGAFNGTQKNCD